MTPRTGRWHHGAPWLLPEGGNGVVIPLTSLNCSPLRGLIVADCSAWSLTPVQGFPLGFPLQTPPGSSFLSPPHTAAALHAQPAPCSGDMGWVMGRTTGSQGTFTALSHPDRCRVQGVCPLPPALPRLCFAMGMGTRMGWEC